jgi:hypothetical protein
VEIEFFDLAPQSPLATLSMLKVTLSDVTTLWFMKAPKRIVSAGDRLWGVRE